MVFDNTSSDTTPRLVAGVVDVLVLHAAVVGTTPDWQVLTLRRAANVRCTGAWEIVHGRIEDKERPADAARREVQEETGLIVDRLYSLTVNPFYLPHTNTVQMAIVFAAVVNAPAPVTLGIEHDAFAWCPPADAIATLAWPRTHDTIRQAMHLLRFGDAGPTEDVLRVR